MNPRGGLPFVWVSWLTGVLSGDQQCVFASWHRAHFRYTKRPSDFNLTAWATEHTALLARRRDELLADGWTVRLENENAFRLKGECAIVAGKPDILAIRHGVVRIVDGKSGEPKAKDWHQVLVYLFAVPRAFPDLRGYAFEGEVCYRTHAIPIGGHELTPDRVTAIANAVKSVASAVQPAPVPSAAECRFCELAECTARIDTTVPEVLVSEF